jgi:hypothetical protein
MIEEMMRKQTTRKSTDLASDRFRFSRNTLPKNLAFASGIRNRKERAIQTLNCSHKIESESIEEG